MTKLAIPILEDKVSFTPFYFYNFFIKKVADFYRNNSTNEKIIFKLIKEDDIAASSSDYHIDPISIPLILSLCEQLRKYQGEPIELFLYNNHGTEAILKFLEKSDFFYLIGDNRNSNFPRGKNIFKFDERYLWNIENTRQRPEHKVRSYSLNDDNLYSRIDNIKGDENQRDFLIEYFSYKVKSHFEVLLNDNPNTEKLQNLFIEILSELITNGVLHSKSDTYASMFTDTFKTKFSISDNGIGLAESMLKKEDTFIYSKFDLSANLRISDSKIFNINNNIQTNLYSIFETLYYSMLKNRKGLFDLMCNVVINCSGYFRLHTENCQIIISNRMLNDLIILYELRLDILKIHNEFIYEFIDEKAYEDLLLVIKDRALKSFLKFYRNTVSKFNSDVKFSSIRIYEVRFRGVHIEVEIPNIS